MLQFEFDENKSLVNLSKHGISFDDAQLLWNDHDLVEIPAKDSKKELRLLVIGSINNKYWTAIITYRGKNIRIISVRRSRLEEVNFYES